ncbi:MAG: hypothetical protein AAGJ81_13060 [Verrucomicrobiota bacterium]
MNLKLLSALAFLHVVGVALSAQNETIEQKIEEFAPNFTLTEQVLAFGGSPEAAERAAMIRAWEIAREGVFKVKNVGLSKADGEDYCVLTIQHRVYQPPDTNKVGEMVVGYGRDPRQALANAYTKAMQRIRDNPRSRPNLTRSTLPFRSSGIMPMPKDKERDFIDTSIRFWGKGSDWRCYFKFDYLEMK